MFLREPTPCLHVSWWNLPGRSFLFGDKMNAPSHIGDHEKPLGWRQWVEPWYLAYALLGISVAGVAPILLPLSVSETGSIAEVGVVMAAFNLGGLMAPFWGNLADRHRWHREVLAAGLFGTAITLAAFAFIPSLPARIVLALLQGAGAAAAATVANLFVVEVHPEAEWDKRIGWLQTLYGGGQVAGLLLAGILSRFDLRLGLLIAAALTLLAFLPGWFMTPAPSTPRSSRPVLRHPARHAELSAGSPQRFYHHPNRNTVQEILRTLFSPFGVFLIGWLISFAGAAAFFALYPIIMLKAYQVSPSLSSGGFAVAAALGLMLYVPAGAWSTRFGAIRVMQVALGIRGLAFLALLSLGIVGMAHPGALALLCFLFLVLAWSMLSVTGTAVTAKLSAVNEGEGLGLFNATTALGGVIGAIVGGWLAEQWGYDAVPIMGLVGIVAGIILSAVSAALQKGTKMTPSRVDS
jgi:DHA1 family tetracycline resistance protein-like MFS transporter